MKGLVPKEALGPCPGREVKHANLVSNKLIRAKFQKVKKGNQSDVCENREITQQCELGVVSPI